MKIISNLFPIFGGIFKNTLHISMWDDGDFMKQLTDEEIKNQKLFQKRIEELNQEIVISWFLENRKRMFEVLWCEQMVLEWRFYHLWLDLSVKKWTQIFAPIDGEVFDVWYEEWEGNYGWYIILKHNISWETFYSLYGHLSYDNISIKKWDNIKSWEKIWIIWDYQENGWYFHHLHLQIITEKWRQNWFFSKGYCSFEQLDTIEQFVLNPNILFSN